MCILNKGHRWIHDKIVFWCWWCVCRSYFTEQSCCLQLSLCKMNFAQKWQWKFFLKIYNNLQNLWNGKKFTIKGNNSLFVALTLLYIIAVYSLSLSIIIFKIITKSCKMFLKLPFKGQQPNYKMPDWSENFRTDRSWLNEQICSKCYGFRNMSQKLHFSFVLISHVCHVGWRAGSSDTSEYRSKYYFTKYLFRVQVQKSTFIVILNTYQRCYILTTVRRDIKQNK